MVSRQAPSIKKAITRVAQRNFIPADVKPNIDIPLFGKPEEKNRFASIVNQLLESETGRETMEIAAQGGYKIVPCDMFGVFGYCDPEKKVIALSTAFSDGSLVATLAHEARHAGQFVRGSDSNMEKDSIKSIIMRTRAMEADAEATAAIATWELKEKGNPEPWKSFANDGPTVADAFTKAVHPTVVAAFESAIEARGFDKNYVMTEAFKGWYDNTGIKEAYENSYYVQPLQWAMRKGIEGEMKFEKDESGKDVIANICVTKDANYFTDEPQKLENGKFLDISKQTKNFLTKFFDKRKEKSGKEIDPTLAQIPVRKSRYDESLADIVNAPSTKHDTIAKRQKEALRKLLAIKRKKEAIMTLGTIPASHRRQLENIAARKNKQR